MCMNDLFTFVPCSLNLKCEECKKQLPCNLTAMDFFFRVQDYFISALTVC